MLDDPRQGFPRLAMYDPYDVYLESVRPEYRVAVIRIVRCVTGVGLREAMKMVDRAPVLIRESTTLDDAQRVKAEVEGGFFPSLENKEWISKGGRRRSKIVARDKSHDPPPGTICCNVSIREHACPEE